MNKSQRIISSLESVIKTLNESLNYHSQSVLTISMTITDFKAVNDKLSGCIKELKGKVKKHVE